ncbi:MAG TPA: hypothetical protein VFY16_07610, partial [Gemmatimonadaceae bacterium]|nr:hypothetical protein [Gemmatimonadaceae bacterium]
EQLLPAEVMHRLALEECRGFLDRLAADSVYVDFRSRRALDEKERWLSGERSLGELTIARDKAARVRDDVIELGDERATTGAQAVCHALSADPSHAFRNVVYKVLAIYDTPDEVARVKDLVRRRLREHGARAAAPFTT